MASIVTQTYTYNSPNITNIDHVRRYISDVDITDGRWTDEEITDFLTDAGQNLYLAAAELLDTEATDAARVANIIKLGTFGDNEETVYQALVERAKHYRKRSGAGVSILAPDAIFTMDSGSGTILGTTNGW